MATEEDTEAQQDFVGSYRSEAETHRLYHYTALPPTTLALIDRWISLIIKVKELTLLRIHCTRHSSKGLTNIFT